MTLMTPHPTARRDDDSQALFEEARRRRQRRWAVGVVATIVVLAGTAALVVVTRGGNSSVAPRITSPHPFGLLVNNGAYAECTGSAHVGEGTSPDGLPADASGTDNLSFVERVAENMATGPYLGFTHQITALPARRNVRAVRVGPGGGWVWSRSASGQVRVIPVKDYGIYVYLRAASQCPTGGWTRWTANGVQVTFLAPKR
jgi:hypothetical protein